MDCKKDAIDHSSIESGHHDLPLQQCPVKVVPKTRENHDQRGRKLLPVDPLWGLGYGRADYASPGDTSPLSLLSLG